MLAIVLAGFGSPEVEAVAEPCDTVDVEYLTAASLELRDTPQGAGNGFYRIGPGRAVVRVAGNDARLIAYEMRESFVIDSKVIFWTTHVTNNTVTHTESDACGVVARGTLAERKLTWTSPLRGYRTDGTITCAGSLCGKFGAPPPGTSEIHLPPHDVAFSPWSFSADKKTFSMANTFVTKSEQPKQTAYIALAGREVRRSCANPKPCR